MFDRWLTAAARLDPRIVCVDAGATPAASLSQFITRFPQRHFEVARTEQHAVTFAAGLAADGCRPVVAITSSLLQRAYDQLVHDVVLQQLPVLLAVDGAGLVGGAAGHQGSFDLSYLRCLPGLTLATPGDENECRQLLHTASLLNAPAVVRFPDGAGPGTAEAHSARQPRVRPGRAALRGWQRPCAPGVRGTALRCAPGRRAARCDPRQHALRQAMDEELLARVCAGHRALVTIEENSLLGGAGSASGRYWQRRRIQFRCCSWGSPDRFMAQATREASLSAAGLDAAGLTSSITRWWNSQRRQQRVVGSVS